MIIRNTPTPPGMNPPTGATQTTMPPTWSMPPQSTGTTTSTTVQPSTSTTNNTATTTNLSGITYDWEKFTGQDFVWIIRTNASFMDALDEYKQFVESGLEGFISNQVAFVNTPSGTVAAQDYEIQDILDAVNFNIFSPEAFETVGGQIVASNEGQWVDEQYWDIMADGMSISEIRQLPYYLTDDGLKEMVNKLQLGGYIRAAGGTAAPITDPSSPYLQRAWDMLLRDVLSNDTNIATQLTSKVEANLDELNKWVARNTPNTGMMINNVSQSLLGRNLSESELQRVLDTVTQFDDEEQRLFAVEGETPNMEADAIRALQQMLPIEIQEFSQNNAVMDLMNWRPGSIRSSDPLAPPDLTSDMFRGAFGND